MINIPKLTIDNILSIESKNEYENLNDFELNSTRNSTITINIDIEDYCSQLEKQEAISETFGDISNNLIEPAFDSYEETSSNSNYYNLEVEITGDSANDFSKEYFELLLKGVNETINNMINEKLGVNLEIFIKSKQQEQESDLLTDYNINIANALQTRIHEELGSAYKFLSHSEGVNFHYADTRQYKDRIIKSKDISPSLGYDLKLIKRHNSAHDDAIEPTRLKQIKEIESNKYVENISLVQKNNYYLIRVYTNEDFKDYIKKTAKEETQRFYNSPRHGNEKGLFLGRVNDGKGNDADVWNLNNALIVKNSQGYIEDKDNELFIKSQNLKSTLKQKTSRKP